MLVPSTDGKYKLSTMDTASDPSYYGYITLGGKWYIKELDESEGTIKYCYGINGSDFTTYWINRANLTYNYIHET